MKVSRAWLQTYFENQLPDAEKMRDALTFHSSEVEEMETVGEDTMMDVKVLPDRAGYALCHRGIARELSAALALPLASDPLLEAPLDAFAYPSDGITVAIDDATRCTRFVAVRMDGVKVGPSPEWLRQRLETVGQRSINNVVDATNFVMLSIGQPLHAFDASKLEGPDGIALRVRPSVAGETMTALGGIEYKLPEGTLVVSNGTTGDILGIAGVKGGTSAELTDTTTSIVLEAANFTPTGVRRTAQALKLFTDASLRFQNGISPELVTYGMRDVVALITEIAGGTVSAVVDAYPVPAVSHAPVTATTAELSEILGIPVMVADVREALDRLALAYVIDEESVTVTPPFERSDLVTREDLAEEVGRILGYDRVLPVLLPEGGSDQAAFRGYERIRDRLASLGFSEISTPSFDTRGDILLANPLQSDRPYLRASLGSNMLDALARAREIAPLAIGPEAAVKLFELGTVFRTDGEHMAIALGIAPLTGKYQQAMLDQVLETLAEEFGLAAVAEEQGIAELSLADVDLAALGKEYTPETPALGMYVPFSPYPFAIRDVAVWVPEAIEESEVASRILGAVGELAVRMDRFDRFEKDGRVSYAFRLILQSAERTLSDADIDPAMATVYEALKAIPGAEIR